MQLRGYLKYCLSLFLFLLSMISQSQVPIDAGSNYSGMRPAMVNPSLLSTSFCYAEFGTDIGFGIYNDFLFLRSKDYFNLMRYGKLSTDYIINGKLYPVGFVIDSKPKSMYEWFEATALSVMFCPDGKLAAGLFVNGRVCSSAKRVPYELPEIAMVSLDDNEEYFRNYSSKNTSVGMMAWNEVGLSLAGTVYNEYFSKIDCGVSVKALFGISAASLKIKNMDYDLLGKDSIFINSSDIISAMSLPIGYDTDFSNYGDAFPDKLKYNGYGVAFDIGVTYTEKIKVDDNMRRKKMYAVPKTYYYYKMGISLLDVGAVRFRTNSIVNELLCRNMFFDLKSLENVTSFQALVDTCSLLIYGDAGRAGISDHFLIGLPSAVCLQFDARMNENIYINASWIQPVRFFTHSVLRSPQIVLAPRFESRFFDFIMSLSLLDYKRVLMGMSARFAFVTVGTHNLLNLMGLGNSYGLDIYVSLRFRLLKGSCLKLRDACWSNNFR